MVLKAPYMKQFGDRLDGFSSQLEENQNISAIKEKLNQVSMGDKYVSLGKSSVNYNDAENFTDTFNDLTNWTTSGSINAESNKVYSTSTSGVTGSGVKYIALNDIEDLVLWGSFDVVEGGNVADFATVRLTKTSGSGSAYTSQDSFGLGFNADGRPMYYVGSNIGGSGTVYYSSTPIYGTWTYLIHVDSLWISISLTSPDGLTTYKTKLARSIFNTGVNFVAITQNDRRGMSGTLIRPLCMRKATVSPSPRNTFSNISSREIYTQTNLQNTRIILPKNYDSRVPCPVIISSHGNTQTQDHMTLSDQRKTFVKYFTDAGFIYASSLMSGNQWGAQQAINDLISLWKYLRDHYAVGQLVILGESMGALATMNAVHRGALPVAGIGIVDGVLNLGWQYQNGISGASIPDSDGIKTAYGIASDGSDYNTKTNGYDPALANPINYRGVPIRFVASPDDTRVPKAQHADILYNNIHSVYPSTTELITGSGGHTVDSHFFLSIWGDFFKSCVGTL